MTQIIAPQPLSIAAASQLIMAWDGLSLQRRRALRRALEAVAELERRPPEAVMLHPLDTLARFERATAVELDLKPATKANYVSNIRYALRRLGFLAPARSVVPVSDPAWTALLDALPQGPDFARLRSFLAWCADQGLAPAAVTQAALEAYADHRLATRGGGRQPDHSKRVADLWNRAGREVPGWPAQALRNPRPKQLSLPFDAYPPPLAQEVETFLTDLAGKGPGGLFDATTALPPVRPATVETRKFGIRRLLHGAREGGIPMERLAHLAVLTEPDCLQASLNWHYMRKGQKVGADLGVLAATAVSLAQRLPGLPEGRLAEVKALVSRIKRPAPTGLTERNARLLDALEDRNTRLRLLHLSARLMQEAARLRDGWTDKQGVTHAPRPHEAAWLAGVAVAIEISLHAPLRLENLTHLRLGEELTLTPGTGTGRQGRALLRVSEDQVKNGRVLEFLLEGDSLRLLRDYLDHYRPLLTHAAGVWLFPGHASAAAPRNKNSFGRAITDAVHQHVGVRMNPHAFRCCVGAMILEANPHAVDDVRAILGHAGFETAMKYYRRFETRGAAQRLSQTIAQQRRAGPVAPPASLAQRLRKVRP